MPSPDTSRCYPETWSCPRPAQRSFPRASAARATRPAPNQPQRRRPHRQRPRTLLRTSMDEAARRNIQGNIVPGFNKDHQHFLFYRITDVLRAKKFLRVMSPSITSMDEVLDFVRAHRALRLKLGVTEPPGLKATWVNIAFSCRGIEKLGAGTGEQFGEQSFRQGLGGAFDIPRRPDRSLPSRPPQPLESRRSPQRGRHPGDRGQRYDGGPCPQGRRGPQIGQHVPAGPDF